MPESRIWSLSQEEPLEEEMTTHSSTLAWEIQWTEEPGRLQSMGSHKSRTQLRNWTAPKNKSKHLSLMKLLFFQERQLLKKSLQNQFINTCGDACSKTVEEREWSSRLFCQNPRGALRLVPSCQRLNVDNCAEHILAFHSSVVIQRPWSFYIWAFHTFLCIKIFFLLKKKSKEAGNTHTPHRSFFFQWLHNCKKAFQDWPRNSTKPINVLKFSWQRSLCQQYIKPFVAGCSSHLNSYKNVWALKTYLTEAASLDISSPKHLQIANLHWKSRVIVGRGNGELCGEGSRGQGWEKKRCKLQSWGLLGGERDYFKEIAPENVTLSRRLMLKSVFSVGNRLGLGR